MNKGQSELVLLAFLTFISIFSCAKSLLTPEPAGPLYGIPFSTKAAARFVIPATAAGKCEKGKNYVITQTNDLRRHESELQCIYSSGLTPTKIPEGPQYGKVLLALNSRHPIINPIVSLLWRGNFAIRAQCNSSYDEAPPETSIYARANANNQQKPENGSDIYIGFHNILGRATLPCLMYVAPLKGEFAPGEYEDGKPSGILDFSKDLTKICRGWGRFYAAQMENASFPVSRRTLANTNLFPQTQIYDVFRLVGQQRDGGKIYLGKTYFRDYYQKNQQMATIAFWYMVNYDQDVNTDFKSGDYLPPVEADFRYVFPGVTDIVLRFLPFDNLIKRPFRSAIRLGSGLTRSSKTTWVNVREYLSQIGSQRNNRRRLKQYWSPRRTFGNGI